MVALCAWWTRRGTSPGWYPDEGPNPQHRSKPMSKATHTLKSPAPLSKPDDRDWTHETFRVAYAMARRMIRDRVTHGTGAAYTWFLQHARRRFPTPTGWRIAQLAGRVAFDARTVMHARAGSVADP